jgi:tyrosine-protein phosphatase non-receptor type 13 protein
LDNDQRLEKFAPSGWKTTVKNGTTPNFNLYLRFKFYPKRTEFVRNEITTHLLYLQLRQDILSGVLTAPKQQLLEAGANALQAEFCDRPEHVTEYFDIHNYLPGSLLAGLRADDLKNTHNNLVQLHSKLAGSNRRHSERTFIQLAQTFSCFGAHFYAVYKFKPAKRQERNSLINDIQNIQLIAIMPHGIGICRNASQLKVDETVEWPFIRVLQYDGKRLLIATIENNIAVDHVFYTDHFTKSRYLVRFSVSFVFGVRMTSLVNVNNKLFKGVGKNRRRSIFKTIHENSYFRRTSTVSCSECDNGNQQ